MIRTVTIVPAILTNSKADYREQLVKFNPITHHIQVDITDGIFAENRTIDLSNVWWPKGWQVDIHLMAKNPSEYLSILLKMRPSLCILHAEADEDLTPTFAELQKAGIKTGVALIPSTYPGNVKPYIDMVDHVLIFAGQIGVQGSTADMMQMEKIGIIRQMKPEVEIGWDGGANMQTMRALAHADLDIINVGSALTKANNPAEVYAELTAEIDKSGVVL